MADRFGTNSSIYDLSRLMTFAMGVPAQNIFSAPIILDNPAITSGIALFSHTPQPFTVAVAAASELSLFDLNFANTGAAGTQFYGIKIQSNNDVVDTGAGIALFNLGRADAIYIDVAGKAANPVGNNPTGIGIDVNKAPTSSAERASANSRQIGIQIFDWSTTNQSVGGPAGMLLQKIGNLNTDHFLATYKANRNHIQIVVVSGDAGYNAGMPILRVDDETTAANWWTIVASGEQVFSKNGIGIQWITPGAMTAYILASTNDLKLKSGGTGIRFVNQADTQTIVMMQDDLSVDIPNNEVRFKALKIVEDRIENTITNALAAVSLNYNGYNGGTTQFRDTKFFDGKQNVVAMFTGTYKNFLFGTATDKATGTPHILINDGSQILQFQNSTTGYLALAWNAWYDGANWKRRVATNPATQVYIGVGTAAGALEIAFPSDANNTVDSTITFARSYYFGPGTIGFFGGGPSVKATVSGWNGGNPALASLLTGLNGYGLITDSSTGGTAPTFGSIFGNEIGWSQASAAQNTWYLISDADIDTGNGGVSGMTHDGSGKITVTNAGTYKIIYAVTLECSALNKHVQTGIAANGSVINDGVQHYEVATPSAQLTMGSVAHVGLAASATIEIAVRTTDTGTPDLSVDHINVSVTRIA